MAAASEAPKSTCELVADMPFPDGTHTYFKDEDLVEGETVLSQVGNAVYVLRPGFPYLDGWNAYNRSNRGFRQLEYFYSKSILSIEALRGLKVLDIATGGGKFVRELRAGGVDAYGLDIALSSLQLPDIFRLVAKNGLPPEGIELSSETGTGFFVQADAAQTGLAAHQFDRIFSTYGPFEYDTSNPTYLRQLLEEMRRILKVGGMLYISPFWGTSSDERFREWVAAVEGLELVEIRPVDPDDPESRVFYAEIRRVF